MQMKPTTLVLEPTNRCNLSCPFCMVGVHEEYIQKFGDASHNNMRRSQGSMKESTFNKVIAEAKSFGIKKIQFHFQGEPLMHKNFVPMLVKLKQEGFYVQFFTNGLLLNKNNIAMLIDSGVNLIRFSIDGLTQGVYEKNRVGGNCKKVFSNLKQVIRSAKGTKTNVEWQFIVLSNNEHQIKNASILAKRLRVKLFLKKYAITDEQLVPKNRKYVRRLQAKPCITIYRQLCIYWNGDVVPCCYDTDGRNILGNINTNSLLDIWQSKIYDKFRSSVTKMKNEPIICKTCLYWGSIK